MVGYEEERALTIPSPVKFKCIGKNREDSLEKSEEQMNRKMPSWSNLTQNILFHKAKGQHLLDDIRNR